jgi:hypothetical protein
MADRRGNSSYGSFGIPEEETTNPTARGTITREVGPAASANRTETIEPAPLVLSSLVEPPAGVRGFTSSRAESARRSTVQRSPDLTSNGAYSLLDDRPVPGSFLYGHQGTDLRSEQSFADNEYFTHEIGEAPRPLLQLGFGDWRLPVMLSGSAISR